MLCPASRHEHGHERSARSGPRASGDRPAPRTPNSAALEVPEDRSEKAKWKYALRLGLRRSFGLLASIFAAIFLAVGDVVRTCNSYLLHRALVSPDSKPNADGTQTSSTPAADIDLDTQILRCLHALDALPAGHSGRSECLFQLSRLHLLEDTSFCNLETALRYLRDAIADAHRNPQLRLTDGLSILESIDDRPWDYGTRRLLLEVHGLLVRLLPRVAYFGLDVRSRLRVLQQGERLANDASAHALMLSDPVLAIELSEEGSGVFWSQAMQLRTSFDSLPSELARRLVSLSRELEDNSHAQNGTSVEETAGHGRRLSLEFEALLDEARTLPGFENFLMPETYAFLRGAAKNGPVVMLIASRVACQAVLVQSDAAGPRQVPLAITYERLCEMGTIARDENVKCREMQDQRGMKIIHASDDRSYALLAELWQTIVVPVIDAFGLKKSHGRSRPRLWWCSTGPFAFLPLHAAGIYNGDHTDNSSQYFVSSYTPMLRALIFAQSRIRPRANASRALLAAVPSPPAWPALPYALQEISTVRAVVPEQSIIALPCDEDAELDSKAGVTIQTLIDRMPGASILHLASHGRQVANDPLESGFVMQDGILTIARLMQLELPHAAFAFLSACETARADKSQPDQTMHLAAAIMFAGFPSVIGTMWAMGDRDGPVVASAVYRKLFTEGALDLGAVPYALDEAVGTLRAEGAHPSRWATYIHFASEGQLC